MDFCVDVIELALLLAGRVVAEIGSQPWLNRGKSRTV